MVHLTPQILCMRFAMSNGLKLLIYVEDSNIDKSLVQETQPKNCSAIKKMKKKTVWKLKSLWPVHFPPSMETVNYAFLCVGCQPQKKKNWTSAGDPDIKLHADTFHVFLFLIWVYGICCWKCNNQPRHCPLCGRISWWIVVMRSRTEAHTDSVWWNWTVALAVEVNVEGTNVWSHTPVHRNKCYWTNVKCSDTKKCICGSRISILFGFQNCCQKCRVACRYQKDIGSATEM